MRKKNLTEKNKQQEFGIDCSRLTSRLSRNSESIARENYGMEEDEEGNRNEQKKRPKNIIIRNHFYFFWSRWLKKNSKKKS